MAMNHYDLAGNSRAKLTGIGTYVPERVLTNGELERMVETNDEWIVQRTGISERRIAGPHEYSSDLAIQAVIDLQRRYNTEVDDVDFIIVATSTADYSFPSTATRIQDYFGIKRTGAMDLGAACAGFVYGLHLANAMISSGLHRKILVVGAETLSKITDYTDRSTCILFGDGAGAVLVEADTENPGFYGSSWFFTEGGEGRQLYQAGLSEEWKDTHLSVKGKLVQNGREVYKWAVRNIPEGMRELIRQNQLSFDDIDWFVPHSANLRMIESICEKSGFPIERTLYSMVRYGNTSAASIPLSIDLGVKENKIKSGDSLMLLGFGGGLVAAGLIVRWN